MLMTLTLAWATTAQGTVSLRVSCVRSDEAYRQFDVIIANYVAVVNKYNSTLEFRVCVLIVFIDVNYTTNVMSLLTWAKLVNYSLENKASSLFSHWLV